LSRSWRSKRPLPNVRAEALSARLCNPDNKLTNEDHLLHRDGRLTHVEMEADSGKLISRAPHDAREALK
jgi:hypothetical protein